MLVSKNKPEGLLWSWLDIGPTICLKDWIQERRTGLGEIYFIYTLESWILLETALSLLSNKKGGK